MKTTLLKIYATVIIMTAMLSGCSQREIIRYGDETTDIHIVFDWEHAPEASPGGMTVYLYPMTADCSSWRFDIPGRDGGMVEIPMGSYSMIAVNNDLPGVVFSGNDSFGLLTANARMSGAEDGLKPTGMLYGAVVGRIDVSPCGVAYSTAGTGCKECPKGVVRCSPDSISTVIEVDVSHIKGLENVTEMRASAGGVAQSVTISTGHTGKNAATSPFRLTPVLGTSDVYGYTTAFCGHDVDNMSLKIYAMMNNGKSYVKNIDSEELKINRAASNYVIITYEGLSLPDEENPDPDDPDIGMSVGVEGWQEYEVIYDTSDPENQFP